MRLTKCEHYVVDTVPDEMGGQTQTERLKQTFMAEVQHGEGVYATRSGAGMEQEVDVMIYFLNSTQARTVSNGDVLKVPALGFSGRIVSRSLLDDSAAAVEV
jgi:hypothetical protein